MMTGKQRVLGTIIAQGLLPLFFYKDAAVSLEIIQTLYKAGVRVIEYTNRGEESLDNFIDIKKIQRKTMPDLYLGIGTIKTLEEAEAFISAGTDFIVSPIMNAEVAKIATEQRMLWIPGCMTPTEIHVAQQHGAELIKLFPGNILGPGFMAAIKDLFPGQLFIPTGGVDMGHKNIHAWFHAGVCAVGMGSKLISKEVLDNRLYEQLYNDTVKILATIQSIK
jgi:2-dehydro-3-deoxyphosphogluconate aldolase/(4S)-4-hydroxy-2-oxoglutarate aldolase